MRENHELPTRDVVHDGPAAANDEWQQPAEGRGREAALESLRPQESARDGLEYPDGHSTAETVNDECGHDVQDPGVEPAPKDRPDASPHRTSDANNRISGLSSDSRAMDSNFRPSFSSRRIEASLSGDATPPALAGP